MQRASANAAHELGLEHGEALPAEVVTWAEGLIAAMQAWATSVVTAWLQRCNGRFEWHDADYTYQLEADVEGRSIYDGECLITRVQDGFIAAVNGRRYRSRHSRMQMQLLQSALVRSGVSGHVVPLPYPRTWIGEEELERWYHAARRWDRLSLAERAEQYASIARSLVDAFLGDGRCETYADGYYLAQGSPDAITVAAECIAARAAHGSRIALVSARRYPIASFRSLLRTAVRCELESRGIPTRDLRPACTSYMSQWDLMAAWEKSAPRLSK